MPQSEASEVRTVDTKGVRTGASTGISPSRASTASAIRPPGISACPVGTVPTGIGAVVAQTVRNAPVSTPSGSRPESADTTGWATDAGASATGCPGVPVTVDEHPGAVTGDSAANAGVPASRTSVSVLPVSKVLVRTCRLLGNRTLGPVSGIQRPDVPGWENADDGIVTGLPVL